MDLANVEPKYDTQKVFLVIDLLAKMILCTGGTKSGPGQIPFLMKR